MATSRVYKASILYLCIYVFVAGPNKYGILLVLSLEEGARSVIFKEALVQLIRSTGSGKES